MFGDILLKWFSGKDGRGCLSKGIDMGREHRFEIIEHTADFGVIGKGATMAEAFENAAYGMFTIVADLEKYQPTTQKEITVAGSDDVNMFERFLSSLLVVFDGDALLPLDFEITEISMGRLTCWVDARPVADDIEWLGPAVKAVTYHQMAVENKNGEWQAKAIFDV
jgi:SHS2 domain-containing protein